jgi:hypothetical protein
MPYARKKRPCNCNRCNGKPQPSNIILRHRQQDPTQRLCNAVSILTGYGSIDILLGNTLKETYKLRLSNLPLIYPYFPTTTRAFYLQGIGSLLRLQNTIPFPSSLSITLAIEQLTGHTKDYQLMSWRMKIGVA